MSTNPSAMSQYQRANASGVSQSSPRSRYVVRKASPRPESPERRTERALSTSTTDAPACAARIAATQPAMPPPTISTSASIVSSLIGVPSTTGQRGDAAHLEAYRRGGPAGQPARLLLGDEHGDALPRERGDEREGLLRGRLRETR